MPHSLHCTQCCFVCVKKFLWACERSCAWFAVVVLELACDCHVMHCQGVEPNLRREVWKYLLGYFDWNMTTEEVKSHRRKKE